MTKSPAVILGTALANIVLSAVTATVVVHVLPPRPAMPPPQAPVETKADATNQELVALLRELVEAERKKQAKEAQQEAATRRYLRPMAKDSTPERWEFLPKPGAVTKPAEP